MSTIALPGLGSVSARRKSTVSVDDTYWGYIIREATDRFDRETVLESSCRFMGLLLVVCAYGQWLLPGSLFTGDVLTMKMAMSFFFGATGVAIYWFASRGLRSEIQIDTTRREVRIVNRNSRGQTRLRSRLPFRDVESAFIKRSKDRGAKPELVLRLRRRTQPQHIATADEAALLDLHARLCTDLRPVAERLEDRLARRPEMAFARSA